MRYALSALLWLLLSLSPGIAVAQEQAPAPTISLLTFAPGEIYWQRFGHNALLVREPGGRRNVYNYGVFDFQQKNFFLNFARGHMLYQLVEQPLYDTLRAYHHEGRWAYEQQLDLDETQRRELAAFLSWNAWPQNAEYRYDYFRSNCSTRVRDAIDRVLGGELQRQLQAQPAGVSYRFEATRLIGPVRPLFFGMDAVMGADGDVGLDRWQQSFVPMELMEAVRGVRLRDAAGVERPLVRSEGWLVHSDLPREPAQPPAVLPALLALGLLLAAALLLLSRHRGRAAARWAHATLACSIALACGLGGLVLLAIWGLTEHWVMWANRNLLLFSPLCLALLPLWLRSFRSHWRIVAWERGLVLLVLAAAVLSLPLLLLPGAQQNLPWIALLLPLHAALAWTLHRSR
ncbi:MAG TPA: DUF4105 domain-containing protein [Solimonas sp.]|nr:DUF4105 domain-containing protein [Solimonas sp.]